MLAFMADAATAGSAKNNRYASIVIDASSGAVISERYADNQLYPASLTKIMTLYLVFEALETGVIRRNQRLPVSRRAAAQEPSKLGLEPGSTIRVEDAIFSLVTKSANDVAVVVAEGLAGSEARFAERMTQKARAMGMSRTRFRNASGLHDPGQVSTARDMAVLAQRMLRDYPQHYRYFSTRSFTYAGRTYNNHNKLMNSYEGMDGIKTGYVSKSGFNLVASAVRGQRRLVGVVFGGRTTHTRNAHMKSLLDEGFRLLKTGDIRVASVEVPVRKPRFDAMGLVMNGAAQPPQQQPQDEGYFASATEQGDAGEDSTITGWVVQVGAFSTPQAGMNALSDARRRLPQHISTRADSNVVPLMTSRGVIYRARLSGMDKDMAAHACGVLRGNCLVLSAQ